MDRVISNAVKRRTELREELQEVEKFLELYEKFKGTESTQAAMNFSASEAEHIVTDSTERHATNIEAVAGINPPARGLPREMLRPHIRDAIMEAGRPLTRTELLNAMDRKKIPVGGTSNRAKNMGTILWRLRDDFVSLENMGYWPRTLAYPPANYVPSSSPDSF